MINGGTYRGREMRANHKITHRKDSKYYKLQLTAEHGAENEQCGESQDYT